jgi:hypothetical protein
MAVRIANVVFDAPDSAGAKGVAALYAELLGMQLLSRGDWYRAHGWPADEGDDLDPLVMDDDHRRPNIAFEQAGAGYRAPAWPPDPDRPQQVHLDLAVPDLDAAHATTNRHGARMLADHGDHRVYADVVGHPLCVRADTSLAGGAGRGRIERIVFDGFSPRALAAFWGPLLELPVRSVDTPELVVLRAAGGDDDRTPAVAFQHSIGVAPRWPDPAHAQQLHLDVDADDNEAATALAIQLGAVRLEYLGGGFVFADPSGHPFCLGE